MISIFILNTAILTYRNNLDRCRQQSDGREEGKISDTVAFSKLKLGMVQNDFLFLTFKILCIDTLNNTRNLKGYCNFVDAKTA